MEARSHSALPLRVRVVTALGGISPQTWDACARGSNSAEIAPNPFVSHAFLSTLEQTGCVGGRTGWEPLHVLVEDGAGDLLAAAPCYLKRHSQGEYVFDHAFADALERAGGSYYPKLQVASPFSPVPGPRLLVAPGERQVEARAALIEGLLTLRREAHCSSVHVTFAEQGDMAALGASGFLERHDQQFHFQNEGYADFDAFLATLASRKRKTIRKERQSALAPGIRILPLTGTDITQKHVDAFYMFYMDTGSRKWGRPYLNKAFFEEIIRRMGDRILLVVAEREGKLIAGAINFIGADALYGRNWGCIEDHPFLHFEVCYYQAIDFAIARGLARVEAGAQGEHKLARGYLPSTTYSAHAFGDPRLQRAVAEYLERERQHMAVVKEVLTEEGPFRKQNEPTRETE